MFVKLQPRPRARALSLLMLGVLVIACAPEEEDDGNNGGLGQTPSPIQSDAAVLPDTSVPPPQPTTPDAGNPFVPPVGVPDSGVVTTPPDAGPGIAPIVDAGLMADAGPVVRDAGATSDAGANGDAGGACPTYDDFGRMFMTMYCVSCHMGAAAPRMIRLDTLPNITTQKAAIKRVAVMGTAMPPSGSRPSAAERMKLGQWLDCGPM